MKEISKKTKIVAFLIAIIVIAGIIVTLTIGLRFDLRYQTAKRIELYLQKEFNIEDIKKITDETIPNQEVIIQKVEVYEDSVSILSNDITEEQKSNLINKINEKYGVALSADNVEITTVPHTRGRDIIRPYVIPFIIATVIILVYMAIRYHRLGIIKTIIKTILTLIVTQALLLSIIAITRIPIGRFTIPMVLAVYVLTLIGITSSFEKKLKDSIEKE